MTTYHQLSAISRLLANLRSVSIFQDPEPTLQPPRIPIAEGNGGIRQVDIADPGAPIQVLITSYSQILVNDKVELFWNNRLIDTLLINQDHIDLGTMTLNVPTAVIQEGTPPVHHRVTSAIGGNVYKSHPLNIRVKTNVPGGTDPAPSTPYINENLQAVSGVPELVDEDNANSIVAIIAPYKNMTEGDKLHLSWGGEFVDEHVVQASEVDNPIHLPVPRETIDLVGAGPLVIEYEIRDIVNNWSRWSPPFPVEAEVGSGLLRAPDALDAADGKIDLAQLGDEDARVRVRAYAEMAEGDTITITWRARPPVGDPVEHSHVYNVNADNEGLPVEVTVPNAIVRASAGGIAAISYSVRSNTALRHSRRTSVEIIGQVQRLEPPTLREAVGDNVDLGQIPEEGATVVVAVYPGMVSGDRVELFCIGTAADGAPSTYYDFRDISGGMEGQPVSFTVPWVFFPPLLNGSLRVYYRVKGQDSQALPLNVVGQGGAELQTPSVVGVVDGVLDPDVVPNGTTAQVPLYVGKHVGDRITLTWQGLSGASYSDFIDVTTDNLGSPINFAIAYDPYIINNLNSNVAVSYRVQRNNGSRAHSAVLDLLIRRKVQDNFVAPSVMQAPTGTLDPINAEQGATVRVAYKGMQLTDIIAVAWTGVGGADTIETAQQNGSASGHVDFDIPVSVVAASQGKIITVRYAVGRGGNPVLSEPLSLPVSELTQNYLPAPTVPQASNLTLDLTKFQGDATANVQRWPLIAVGQRYWIKVSGTLESGAAYSFYVAQGQLLDEGQIGNGLSMGIQRSELERLQSGSSLRLEVKVAFDGGTVEAAARIFPDLTLTLLKDAAIIPSQPRIPIAPDGRLNFHEDMYYSDYLTVEVLQFPGMAAGQSIVVEWESLHFKWSSPPQSVTTVGSLQFEVPRLEVIDAIGTEVKVRYTVNGTIPSPAFPLIIDSQGMVMPPPHYFDRGDRYEVSILSPDQQDRHTGRVRWNGVVARDSGEQDLQKNVIEYFQIPKAWVTENQGQEVLINYSIYRGNQERFRFSRVLRLKL
ncbi:hypothetical protein [Pseudomonas sp. UM16]|uniref:hypothetical protein n=1 Tax=Pseudomonas sp. UM16 TaxID=3158962 RepID=UPI00398FEB3F